MNATDAGIAAEVSRHEGGAAAPATRVAERVVEIVGPRDDGAVLCGRLFAATAASSGLGVWAREIGAAAGGGAPIGLRVRLTAGSSASHGGDGADLVVAFDEKQLLARVRAGALRPGTTVLLDDGRGGADPALRAAVDALRRDGCTLHGLPIERRCGELVSDPRKAKAAFVLGLLCTLHGIAPALARGAIARRWGENDKAVVDSNMALVDAGAAWAPAAGLDFGVLRAAAPAPAAERRVLMSGSAALAAGLVAAGIDICAVAAGGSPAVTEVAALFAAAGGTLHRADDDGAACAFAAGASHAGRCAAVVTAEPALALPAVAFAARAEIPLVVVGVQQAAAERGDLAAVLHGGPADAPPIVIATDGVEDGLHAVVTARKLAETLRAVVVVLVDAGVAAAEQAFARPAFVEEALAAPVDRTPVPEGALPYDWHPASGLSRRIQPGRRGGGHTLTALPHDRAGRVAADAAGAAPGRRARCRKLAALQQTLKPPAVFVADAGDLLLLGCGGTRGAVDDAVTRLRAEGFAVSSLHLRLLQPLPPGIGERLARFGRALTVEIDGSCHDDAGADAPDDATDPGSRRPAPLAALLRSRWPVDIGSVVLPPGEPAAPAAICAVARGMLAAPNMKKESS